MSLKLAATITTVLVILAGFTMISPLFLRANKIVTKQKVMLSFNITESIDARQWSRYLASLLEFYSLPASVFIVGKLAEEYPQIVSYFGENVDVGSQTYSNLTLTTISDYSLKLQEVQQGKIAVDNAGNLNSGIFRAPSDATDQDIYSLLSRSGILADFSYKNQYNVYQGSQFIKYEAITYQARDYTPEFFLKLLKINKPVIITFDNTDSIASVEAYLSQLKKGNFEFVNASELTGITLTARRDELGNSKTASD